MAFLTLSPENLLTFPSQFDNAAWTKTNASVTADATTAPDGTTTADLVVESAVLGQHGVSRSQALSDNADATFSFYVKDGGRDACYFSIQTKGGLFREGYFRTDTGALYSVNGSLTATAASTGDGWYRISATLNVGTGGTTPTVFVRSVQTAGGTTISYTGDGTSGVYLWGARLVEGAIDVPVAWGGALTRYAEIGSRAVAFDGTARSSVRSRKRVWEGITTAPMSQTDADALYDLLVSAPPLLAVGDMTRHLDVSVHPSNVREAGVWSDASGAYRYSLQFDLREV